MRVVLFLNWSDQAGGQKLNGYFGAHAHTSMQSSIIRTDCRPPLWPSWPGNNRTPAETNNIASHLLAYVVLITVRAPTYLPTMYVLGRQTGAIRILIDQGRLLSESRDQHLSREPGDGTGTVALVGPANFGRD